MDMKKWRDDLVPILLEVMQDPLLSTKREVSSLLCGPIVNFLLGAIESVIISSDTETDLSNYI